MRSGRTCDVRVSVVCEGERASESDGGGGGEWGARACYISFLTSENDITISLLSSKCSF